MSTTKSYQTNFGEKGSPNYISVFFHPQLKGVSATYHTAKGFANTYYFRNIQDILNFIQALNLQKVIPPEEVSKATKYLWNVAKNLDYTEKFFPQQKGLYVGVLPKPKLGTTAPKEGEPTYLTTVKVFDTLDKRLSIEIQPLSVFRCKFIVVNKIDEKEIFSTVSRSKNGFCKAFKQLSQYFHPEIVNLIALQMGFSLHELDSLATLDIKEVKDANRVGIELKPKTGGKVFVTRTYGREFSNKHESLTHGYADCYYPNGKAVNTNLRSREEKGKFFYSDITYEGEEGYFVSSEEINALDSIIRLHFGSALE